MAYWTQIRGVQEPIVIQKFRGVYKSDDDGFNLTEGYAQELRNVSGASFPSLSLRPGYSAIGSALGGRVTGLGVWQGSELHTVANGTWYKLVNGSWAAVTGGGGLNASADWSYTNFKGNLSAVNLLAANGVDAPRRYDGSTVQTLSGAPAGGNFIEQHGNRCYLAVENKIHYSALAKPQDWTTAKDAGTIEHETNDGQKIIGLRAGYQHLTIFKRTSIYELYGTGPSSYKLMPVAEDIGAYSNKAIVNLGGTLYFISTRLYQYGGGTRPSADFSLAVQKYVDGINKAAVDKCVAGSDGQSVYFAIPYGSATECNMVLEYDTTTGAWYVWDGFNPTQYIRMGADCYMGDTGGRVLQMGGTTDAGSPISWKWISPPYSAGTMAKRTSWYNCWVVVDLPLGSSLSVSLSKLPSGDGDWSVVKSITAQNAIQSSRLIIPLAAYANVGFIRIKMEGTGPFRVFELDRQMREMPLR